MMVLVMSPTEAIRFWQRAVPTETGCWLWAGYRDSDGYGILTLAGNHWRAHRAAWTLTHGPIPAGKLILHSCDTPACIRPEHLRPGTAADNTQDRITRSRTQHLAAERRRQAGQIELDLQPAT
jgi:hypothetical protein